MNRSESDIIKRIISGDLDAYKILVDKYSQEIMNLCFRYLNSYPDAEDATQDVFIKAYRALGDWEPRAQFKTWLYRIAINHCLNLVRRQQKIIFQSLAYYPDKDGKDKSFEKTVGEAEAEDHLMQKQLRVKLRAAVNKLPENQRQVIILYYYQKLSYLEIAEILETSLSSVESRLFRAKKSLAKILKKDDFDF
ncbi:MAG: sigma-70 family RNA polymerase sigma factor [Calditrichia bacterium]